MYTIFCMREGSPEHTTQVKDRAEAIRQARAYVLESGSCRQIRESIDCRIIAQYYDGSLKGAGRHATVYSAL